MSKKKSFQFFTTDMQVGWYPIDHFFYAPAIPNKGNGGFVEEGVVVHLETHAALTPSGLGVSVVQGEGKGHIHEEFNDIPSALRRMADIIEAHSKKVKR